MDVLFLGKDNRYKIVIEHLSEKYNVECIGYDDSKYKPGDLENINKYDMIVLPMSGIKKGMAGNVLIGSDVIDKIKDNCIIYTGLIPQELEGKHVISFMDDEEINYENNKITVDGMLDAISDKDKRSICILGYGKIGHMIYDRLKDDYNICIGIKDKIPSHNETFFFTNNEHALGYNLSHSRLIINTVPENIINERIAKHITGHILDVASYPYGIDQHLVEKYHLDYHLYSGIPAKYDPERAGKILLKKFDS